MNQTMYINYTITVYCLNQVLERDIDESLKNTIIEFIDYLQTRLDSYTIASNDKKIPNLRVEELPRKELLKTTYRVIKLVEGTSNDNSIVEKLNDLGKYFRHLVIENKFEEIGVEIKR